MRTQETIEWDNCLIYRNCDPAVEEFMTRDGADELVVTCGGVQECELTEVYVRNPHKSEMSCKVIGSTCAAGSGLK